MYILKHKLCPAVLGKLTFNPCYQAYIHLQDHDQKVNPKQNRLKLSFMDPKKIAENVPSNPEFKAKLRKSAEQELRKRMFEEYKEKILTGKVDQQAVVEPDTLWGQGQKPSHYYQNLSSIKASRVSHSIFKDIQPYQVELGRLYVQKLVKTTEISEVKQLSQLAEVAASYRLNGVEDRSKYYEIQKMIGNKFHLLSNQALILLKYAFLTSPKKGTPEFNKILNDLLYQSLPTLSITELTFLMYFNRHDLFRFHRGNLQISVLQEASKHFKQLSLQNKIDFLFLFIDSRSPTIRPESHNRHVNEIRNRTQQIMCLLNIEGNFSSLSQLSFLKLAYSLVRAKTYHTQHLTLQIEGYLTSNLDKIGFKNTVLFFYYLSKIEAGKATSNLELMKNLKQKIINSWQNLNDLEKLRSLNAMHELGLYDETTHSLYTAIPIQADSSMLSVFCRIQMMNSSGREWEIIHRLVDLQYLPLNHFQDYKRFYNYVSCTAPDWNLQALSQKLQNTEIFYSSARYESFSQDKRIYRGLREFQNFSSIKQLPHKFKMGCPIKNTQFAEFCLPQYQISIDIITDVERIRGTDQLKGSYQLKMKNLECIGWKQLYVMEEDIDKLSFEEFFDYLYSVCEPHFEEQLKVIAQYEQYRSYEISQLKFNKQIGMMKMRERQLYEVVKDFTKIPTEYDLIQKQIAERQKMAKLLQDIQKSGGVFEQTNQQPPK